MLEVAGGRLFIFQQDIEPARAHTELVQGKPTKFHQEGLLAPFLP